ncbi:MAG: DNA (cytosine-5-)-methyltransferase [Thermoplasmatota archaeon]
MTIRVVELFAGVGGFRLGLQRCSPVFETVWWNQWEPNSVRAQHAWDCYKRWFCDAEKVQPPPLSNADINTVDPETLPRHQLLVGGFPCQDYSVATSLGKAGGLTGKKGVLWWAIHDTLKAKKPEYVLLENVDRLLKSPVEQRGRDFAVVLACLRTLGYHVEWRVLNAADWGLPQKRRRVFIFGAHRSTGVGRAMSANAATPGYLYADSFFGSRFPCNPLVLPVGDQPSEFELPNDIKKVSDSHETPFEKAGVMIDGKVWMHPVEAASPLMAFLKDHLDRGVVDPKYLIDQSRKTEWKQAKGPKKIPRVAESGFEYTFAEGGMSFPDRLDRPARTILTSEANRTPNRTTHVIHDEHHNALRVLTPTETERLMGFKPGWTAGMPERWRYFTMGNALVVQLVTEMGHELIRRIGEHEPQARRARMLYEPKTSSVTPVVRARGQPAKPIAIRRRARKWTG